MVTEMFFISFQNAAIYISDQAMTVYPLITREQSFFISTERQFFHMSTDNIFSPAHRTIIFIFLETSTVFISP